MCTFSIVAEGANDIFSRRIQGLVAGDYDETIPNVFVFVFFFFLFSFSFFLFPFFFFLFSFFFFTLHPRR
jgi:hypothetical protein